MGSMREGRPCDMHFYCLYTTWQHSEVRVFESRVQEQLRELCAPVGLDLARCLTEDIPHYVSFKDFSL